MKPSASPARHVWKFHRFGGVDQVMLRNGDDLAHLEELDLKLWMALSMPTNGIQCDAQTTALIDCNHDGRIHPAELLTAVRWVCSVLHDPGILLLGGGRVPLSAIRDPELAASARHLLANLGRPSAEAVDFADVADRTQIFAQTLFNGDGVVPPQAAEADDATRALIGDIVAALGGVMDRSGRLGVDDSQLASFFAQAAATVAWVDAAAAPAVSPLGYAATAKAAAAVSAVRAKVDDYFARCKLAAFDPRATAALNRDEADYRAIAASSLSTLAPEIAAFPLAVVAAAKPLPLGDAANPSWANAIRRLVEDAVVPLLGPGRDTLSEEDWRTLTARLAPFDAAQATKPSGPVADLGTERLRALIVGDLRKRVEALLVRDRALAPESERIASVEKLVRFQRDLNELLTNTVNFADFYGRTGAVFQTGTLYIDARACTLCVDVSDDAKHAAMAGLSGLFLVYCDLARPGGVKRKIAAAVTAGDCDNLMVGRNGVFYDRSGLAWDATVARIVMAPISVRQAFWLPYKRFVRLIEEQIAKRAQAADAASTANLAKVVEQVAGVTKPPASAPTPPAPPKKVELGTIALVGTAIGGISALVGGFLKALFGLGYWLPLGIVGVILLISGPSMLLASLKLRRRNIAPLLDANGWAVNAQARVNTPFGAALTSLATLPPGTFPSLKDPFAEKRRPWGLYAVLLAALLIVTAWSRGWLDPALPDRLDRHPALNLPAVPISEPSEKPL